MATLESEIVWDKEKQALCGWTTINGQRIAVHVPRAMIHSSLSIYSDAIEWEIERFKDDIIDRLKLQLA